MGRYRVVDREFKENNNPRHHMKVLSGEVITPAEPYEFFSLEQVLDFVQKGNESSIRHPDGHPRFYIEGC